MEKKPRILLARLDQIGTEFSLAKLGIKHMPMGILYLAAVLLKDGFTDLRICDEIVGDSIEEAIRDFRPDIVGMTTPSPLFYRAGEVTDLAHRAGCKVILGGPHPTAQPDNVLKECDADLAIMGEGELTMLDICRGRDPAEIKGLIYRDNGQIIRNEPGPRVEDIDTFPFPARHLLDLKKYRGDNEMGFHVKKNENCLRLFTSRGCKYECIFCARHIIFGRIPRYRSLENIMGEIEEGINRYGIRKVVFMDDTLTEDEERVMEISEEILRRNMDIRWACFSRVGTRGEILKVMHRSGCRMVGYGVESGSQKVLDGIKKKIEIGEIEDSFKITRKLGIRTKAFFIVGLPGEGEKEFQETLALARRICPDYVVVSIFTPLPGAEAYDRIMQHGDMIKNRRSFFHTADKALHKRQKRFLFHYYLSWPYFRNVILSFNAGEIAYFLSNVKNFLFLRA